VPARRIRLQKSANDAQVSRDAIPQATGRVDGGPFPTDPQGLVWVQKRRQPARRRPSRSAGKVQAGRSRGRHRAKAFARWKSPRTVTPARLVHASGSAAVSAARGRPRERASVTGSPGEATGVSEARSARTTAGRQRPPRWRTQGQRVARRSESLCRGAGDLSGCAARESAPTQQGTDEARVLVRRSELAETGPTHRASRRSARRKAGRTPRRWPRSTPHDVLTYVAAASR
jgi:hypothetical protein